MADATGIGRSMDSGSDAVQPTASRNEQQSFSVSECLLCLLLCYIMEVIQRQLFLTLFLRCLGTFLQPPEQMQKLHMKMLEAQVQKTRISDA